MACRKGEEGSARLCVFADNGEEAAKFELLWFNRRLGIEDTYFDLLSVVALVNGFGPTGADWGGVPEGVDEECMGDDVEINV